MQTMPIFIQHFQRHLRQIVPSNQQVYIILDGHASRSGREWLEAFDNFNISSVQLPANTTHILQLNDDAVTKCFKEGIGAVCDTILKRALVEFGDVLLKMILAVAGYRSVTDEKVRTAFRNVGLWPMN